MGPTRMDRTALAAALTALGDTLAARGLAYEVVLIGGGNLLLRGLIARTTKDGDLLAQVGPDRSLVRIEALPVPLAVAVRDVGLAFGLAEDWLNVGPRSILDGPLPDGFTERLERHEYGSGLVVWFAGVFDQVCFKLHAAADGYPRRDRHLEDLASLAPSPEDLLRAARWTLLHDASPGYRELLVATLGTLGVDDADARLRQ